MKRIIILTDGATLGTVRLAADNTDYQGFSRSRSLVGGERFRPDDEAREHPRLGGNVSAGERLEFINVKNSNFELQSSIRELADHIAEIVREEDVDFWHLVAPPDVKKRLPGLLDDDVQRRLSRIGFEELLSAAADCAAEGHAAPSWHSAGQSQRELKKDVKGNGSAAG